MGTVLSSNKGLFCMHIFKKGIYEEKFALDKGEI
jgi:hypothetical protein